MEKLNNRILVYLNDELAEWLNEKARNGYKKATLIRKVLEDYRKAEVMRSGSAA
ncbi:MAG: hypothetical protein ACYCO0_05090 [Candidatus Micrarchaeaceae archaeon]